ncbi:MAG: hypothetical protein A3E01_07495 [Gammaproteobacteria bacterium RIFCSPHIGHO2_12_FULL_63_22]|nr:MAG: hypothetical protein A3E01_07495 [Gammaproteobacteria bacterium RIFCSPHIGHO2_12_FULL_63_22]
MSRTNTVTRVRRIGAVLFGLAVSMAILPASANVGLVQGRLQIQVEDHANGRAVERYFVDQASRRVELAGVRNGGRLTSGSTVRARGSRLGNVLALDSTGTVELAATAPAELAYATGVQNVAVILVNFSDATTQPVSAATVQQAVFGTTDAFLRENSGGQAWLSGSVMGWYTLPISKSACDPAQISQLADQAATSAGNNLSAYTRKFYVFPKNACTWAGLADVGGANTRAWFNGKFDLENFGHEFGHNLGLMHSHGLDCDLSPLGTTCTPLSYGDAADIMGNLEGHYNAFQKQRLGWSTGMVTMSASGRVTLAPYSGTSGTRAVRIPRGIDASGATTWYYLEYRQPTGFDTVLGYYGTLSKGVLVRTATEGDGDSTYLLDMTPNSDTSSGFVDLWDSALMAGATYADSVAKVTVKVVSTDATGAVVDVTMQAGGGGGGGSTSNLTETVATSKASYLRGETVGMGSQVLDNGVPVVGISVTFTITRPNGSSVSVNAVTGSNGTASAVYKLAKKDARGGYGLRAQAKIGNQTATANTTFSVQ